MLFLTSVLHRNKKKNWTNDVKKLIFLKNVFPVHIEMYSCDGISCKHWHPFRLFAQQKTWHRWFSRPNGYCYQQFWSDYDVFLICLYFSFASILGLVCFNKNRLICLFNKAIPFFNLRGLTFCFMLFLLLKSYFSWSKNIEASIGNRGVKSLVFAQLRF